MAAAQDTAPTYVNITISKTQARKGEPLSFTADTDGSNCSYTWSFGDSGTSTERVTTHVYTTVGTYTVSVTASNGLGNITANATVSISVPTIIRLKEGYVFKGDSNGVAREVPISILPSTWEENRLPVTSTTSGFFVWKPYPYEYIANATNGGVVYTPQSPSEGDKIKVIGAGVVWTLVPNTNSYTGAIIAIGSITCGSGYALTSASGYDCVELTCVFIDSNPVWVVSSLVGSLSKNTFAQSPI